MAVTVIEGVTGTVVEGVTGTVVEGVTGSQPTLLKALLTSRHWQRYETFCAEYERVASRIAPELRYVAPSRAQYHRWLGGQLKGGTPYPDACRVLEAMFPGWTAADLFSPPEFPAFELAGRIGQASHLLGSYCEAKGTADGREYLTILFLSEAIDTVLDVLEAFMDGGEPDRAVLDKLNSTREMIGRISPRPATVATNAVRVELDGVA
jgi:hypothetical protein